MEENSLGDTETVWKNPSYHTLRLTRSPSPELGVDATAVAASRYSEYNLAESMKLQMAASQVFYSQRETATTAASTH